MTLLPNMQKDRNQLFYLLIIPMALMVSGLVSCDQTSSKPDEMTAVEGEQTAHFHHVHLNTTAPSITIDYYQQFFGANRVKYHDQSEALFTEKSFILLDSVSIAPLSHLGTSIWHIGWAGVDGPSEFQWRVEAGIEVRTPLRKLAPAFGYMDTTQYMYFWGPSREVVEIFTGNRNHRFEHVHLLTADPDKMTQWFQEHLGLAPRHQKAYTWNVFLVNFIIVDNINFIVFGKADPEFNPAWWPKGNLLAPDGTAIDHLGFSFEQIESVFERMKAAGVEIIQDIERDPNHNMNSFFVRGPDSLLIEIVEEKPIPEGIWH